MGKCNPETNYLCPMVLVTGATGLVGSHLVLHLLENNEAVRAMYRNLESIQKTKSLFKLYGKDHLFEQINWVLADINEVPTLAAAFENIAFVYHCAGLISFDPADEKYLRKINIEGTANVVNFCLDFKIKKLCHVSSIAALGDLKPNEAILTEETEWNPEMEHSDYAISKYGAEMEIWRGQQEGLAIVVVNPGVIFGSGFWETGSGAVFLKVAKGMRFYTKGATGFIAVNDVVKMMFQLMKSAIQGERFIAVAETIGFEKLLIQMAQALKVDPPTRYAKPWMTTLVWKIDWVLFVVFNKKRSLSKHLAQSFHKINPCSNQKAKTVLDFTFENVSDAILTTAAFYFKRN